jgi:hypothetical protein
MKTVGGCLIALAIFLIWSILVEIALPFVQGIGHFKFNWPDTLTITAYLAPCVLMLVLGIWMRRRKPKNWIW